MNYKRFNNKILLRADIGEDINELILTVAEKENIKLGSISGIGATNDFTVGVYDLSANDYKKYNFKGNYEITSLTGNITAMNGKPYVHTHITCAGENGSVIGGHLFSLKISITSEIFIDVIDGEISRKPQENPIFNRMEF